MKLQNKVAIVTGGSRGIGKATSIALANEGCNLAICSKNKNNLIKAEKELKQQGVDVFAYLCDLSKPDEIKKFVSAVKKKFGSADILVNNAGVLSAKNLEDDNDDAINDIIDVNIRGLILMTKYVLPILNEKGIIINISSGAGKHGISGLATYCASKFAVIGFTESLAGELKGKKAIAVCPGGVDTDMYRDAWNYSPSLKPEHIAAKILEICTEPHKFASGSSVEVYHVTDALNYLRMRFFGKK